MAPRSVSIASTLSRAFTACHRLPPPSIRASLLFRHHLSSRASLHPASSSCFHTLSLLSSVLSPPTASQSDPDPTLLAPLTNDAAPTLKEALDPALWFPDADIEPAPPTAAATAAASPDTTTAPTDGDGSAETGGLYYTAVHPQLHPVAPIAEAMAPLPCAYTPPDIAPLMDIEDIKRAMESVVVDEEDEEQVRRKAEEALKAKGVEVKGLDELLEEVTAEEEEAKKGALVVAA